MTCYKGTSGCGVYENRSCAECPYSKQQKSEAKEQDNKSKIKELIKRLNVYREAYYNENRNIVSDKEYDMLFDKLEQLECETGIIYSNSPTHNVGYKAVSSLNKVKHNHPLLSLGKTTDINQFSEYFKHHKTVLMAKMDGLTASILYKDGKLISAESRGDGEVGEDITHNAIVFENLPQEIPFKGELIVDGECVITSDNFERINKPLIDKADGEAKKLCLIGKDYKEYIRKHSYANPRNLVSGTVRQLDNSIAKKRNVRFIAWKLFSAKNNSENELLCAKSYIDGFVFLRNLGFEVVDYVSFTNGDSDCFEKYIEKIKTLSADKRYCIDGIVAAFDDVDYGNSLGSTGHHPKHSLAYKFYQDRNETELLDIEWNTSRTGLVNPVAIVEPVEIDGTTVSRASLSNISIIKELQLGIGDTITMIKANQIIPQITDNITRSGTYKIPTVCPSCGHKLITRNDNGREMLYCINKQCFDIIHDKISNFASRDCMNIVGISEERLRTLMNLGYVTNFSSIYSLYEKRTQIERLDGFGKSSAENMLKAIEESKKCKFANVLTAIGIPGIGKSTAKTLSKFINYYQIPSVGTNIFEKFLYMVNTKFNWSFLDGFGVSTSESINSYVIENYSEIEPLSSILIIEENTQDKQNNVFGGKAFCITGKLSLYLNRDALVSDIEKYGGKIVSSVTAKTDYLITNDSGSGSSKNQAAIKFGTKIITEQDFVKMCGK